MSVPPDVEDGAALPLPERPDAILSDEEVCFPSLDRFGGFSATAEEVRGEESV